MFRHSRWLNVWVLVYIIHSGDCVSWAISDVVLTCIACCALMTLSNVSPLSLNDGLTRSLLTDLPPSFSYLRQQILWPLTGSTGDIFCPSVSLVTLAARVTSVPACHWRSVPAAERSRRWTATASDWSWSAPVSASIYDCRDKTRRRTRGEWRRPSRNTWPGKCRYSSGRISTDAQADTRYTAKYNDRP